MKFLVIFHFIFLATIVLVTYFYNNNLIDLSTITTPISAFFSSLFSSFFGRGDDDPSTSDTNNEDIKLFDNRTRKDTPKIIVTEPELAGSYPISGSDTILSTTSSNKPTKKVVFILKRVELKLKL